MSVEIFKRDKDKGDFPVSPLVKTSPSNAGGVGLIQGRGTKIPYDSGPKNQNIKQTQYRNKSSKDLKKTKKCMCYLCALPKVW